MPKQASKVCVSLFIVLSLLANYCSSESSSEQYAPTASESENESTSSESYVSVPPNTNIPDVKTETDQTLSPENVSTLPNANLEGEQSFFDEQLVPSPSVNIDPTIETKGDNNIPTSPSPSTVDNSVLDTRDMDSISQENTSVPLLNADPPAAKTEKSSIKDLFQENTSLPPTSVPLLNADPPAAETEKSSFEDLFQENTSLPPTSVPLLNADPPASETEKSSIEDLFQENTSLPPTSVPSSSSPSLTPAYVDTPSFETTDGGSFTQENHYPSPPPSNTVSETSENVPQLNDYSSLPHAIVPAPSEALSYPELDPTMQLTPSNDYTLDSAPTSDDHKHTILPSNYRAEDEPVEPYEDEEDSWNGGNGAVAGVFVGACVIGVGGFMYQKRKKDTVKAQYESLAKKDDV